MLDPVGFIKEVGRETKKVTWPTRKQTQDMTLLVIGVSVGIGIYIGLLDTLFNKLLTGIL